MTEQSKLPPMVEQWIKKESSPERHNGPDIVYVDDLRAFLATLNLVPDGHVAVPVAALKIIMRQAALAPLTELSYSDFNKAQSALLAAQRGKE